MNYKTDRKSDIIGQIHDLVNTKNPNIDPFLFHLPSLLVTPPFEHIDPAKALTFAKIALRPEAPPIVADARKILNQLINPYDGTLINSGPNIFYENRSFFWKELGGHTSPVDIILHILNKTLFVTSVGQK